jgi:hypothetical protein
MNNCIGLTITRLTIARLTIVAVVPFMPAAQRRRSIESRLPAGLRFLVASNQSILKLTARSS